MEVDSLSSQKSSGGKVKWLLRLHKPLLAHRKRKTKVRTSNLRNLTLSQRQTRVRMSCESNAATRRSDWRSMARTRPARVKKKAKTDRTYKSLSSMLITTSFSRRLMASKKITQRKSSWSLRRKSLTSFSNQRSLIAKARNLLDNLRKLISPIDHQINHIEQTAIGTPMKRRKRRREKIAAIKKRPSLSKQSLQDHNSYKKNRRCKIKDLLLLKRKAVKMAL